MVDQLASHRETVGPKRGGSRLFVEAILKQFEQVGSCCEPSLARAHFFT